MKSLALTKRMNTLIRYLKMFDKDVDTCIRKKISIFQVLFENISISLLDEFKIYHVMMVHSFTCSEKSQLYALS